jgi:hypothetical protein
MNKVIDATAPCWKLSQKLKLAIDPEQLIAPGRYVPYHETPRQVFQKNKVPYQVP